MKIEEKCCNIERVKVALKSLGEEQLEEILNEDKKAEVVCPYCNTKYFFSESKLKKLVMEIKDE